MMTDEGRSTAHQVSLDDRYRAIDGAVFCSGVQALVRLPLDQVRADRQRGHNSAAFISGYPGSPLAGYDKELERAHSHLEALDVVHQPGLNEELAASAVMGSQLSANVASRRFDGVVGLWYGKAPGLDRAGDAIRHGNFAGAAPGGGVVVLAGDDPGAKSSTLPSACEHTLFDLMIPTVAPGTVQEVLDLGRHAIALSRASGLWSGMKVSAAVADATETIEINADRFQFDVNPRSDFAPEVNGRLLTPYTLEREREILGIRTDIARRYGADNRLNDVVVNPGSAWLGLVAPGHTYQQLREALHLLGVGDEELAPLGIRVMRIGLLHPLERQQLRDFASGLQTILVVEDKRPFIELHLRDALYGMSGAPRVLGKRDEHDAPLIAEAGTLSADLIVGPLRKVLTAKINHARLAPEVTNGRIKIPLVARTPYFCSGCPHNSSTVVPAGTLVGGGIGCHSMVVFMDQDQVGELVGLTCMGSEGAQWIGMAPFVATDHLVQNLGDGTYAHSGQLAIQAAVAAGVNITFKLLFNGVVAMTGGQDAVGGASPPRIADTLLNFGVKRVVITSEDVSRYRGADLPRGVEVRDRSRLVATQEELAGIKGVTVLIHDQRCAAEKRRDRKRGKLAKPTELIVINERVCEGCGDCGTKSNCLSVQPLETEFGRKTKIDQGSCNFDQTCLEGDCPSFASVIPHPSVRRRDAAIDKHRVINIAADELPAPSGPVCAETSIRMPGIGGTGVVTVSQVLGMAATLDGLTVSGLDQTGLSQKAGPVAVQPAQLDGLAADRTVVVGSTTSTPTGHTIRHPGDDLPTALELQAILDSHSDSAANVYLDAGGLAVQLFDDPAVANILVLGVACQRGLLPVTAHSIERAIELNGVAVERNVQAFRSGRLWFADHDRFNSLLPDQRQAERAPSARATELASSIAVDSRLQARIAMRIEDLASYQSWRYAQRYAAALAPVAAREGELRLGSSVLTETAAVNLHRLMAYKDEYEVARLLLAQASQLAAELVGGPKAKVVWHLHPPMLRGLGMRKKIRVGRWFRPVLRVLASAKSLRGHVIDPFGHTKVRRTERALVNEYLEMIQATLAEVDDHNFDQAVELLALADMIRGYEHIKLHTVERYRAAVLDTMRQPTTALG
jgi:indolepyruvate ferredoxin oxidoreductase